MPFSTRKTKPISRRCAWLHHALGHDCCAAATNPHPPRRSPTSLRHGWASLRLGGDRWADKVMVRVAEAGATAAYSRPPRGGNRRPNIDSTGSRLCSDPRPEAERSGAVQGRLWPLGVHDRRRASRSVSRSRAWNSGSYARSRRGFSFPDAASRSADSRSWRSRRRAHRPDRFTADPPCGVRPGRGRSRSRASSNDHP